MSMAEIPKYAKDWYDEEELSYVDNGEGFQNGTVVRVTESGREEYRALIEFLDGRNPLVVNELSGVRILPFDIETETLGFESEEAFEESSQEVGWFVKQFE